jgi:phosphatidate cytidylyltransferase
VAENPPLEPAGKPVSRRERRSGRNLPLAIATGVGLAALLLGALVLARPLFVLFVLGVVLLALVELNTVLRARAVRPAPVIVFPMAVLLVVGAYLEGPAALSFGMMLTLLGAFAWYLLDRRRVEVARNIAATVFVVLYLPFLAAHLSLVLARAEHYVGALIGYALVVVVYDTGAYAVGASVGRHPMAPSISPHKSWEGAAGGTVLTLLAGAFVLPLWQPWTLASGLTLAAVACVLAPLGDLSESMIKRDLHVKDMGSILPGHGGMLDRIDALLVVAPALYYVLALFSLVQRS